MTIFAVAFCRVCGHALLNMSKQSEQKTSFLRRAFDLYYDGFRNMTLGRTLWAVIAIKLFIMFAILKVFFFPNFIGQHAKEGQEADFVATEMLGR